MGDDLNSIQSELGGSYEDWAALADSSSGVGGMVQQAASAFKVEAKGGQYIGPQASLSYGPNADTYPAGQGYAQSVRSVLDQAYNTLGTSVSARAIVQAAKQFGVQAAAQFFGLDSADVIFLFTRSSKGRRGRGISARQLRTCGKVIRKMASFNRQLHKYVAPYARHNSPAPAGHKRGKR